MKKDNSVFESIGIWVVAGALTTFFMFIIAIPLLLLDGWVFETIWNWFIYGGLSGYRMTWIIGSGIVVMVQFVTRKSSTTKDVRTDKEKITYGIAFAFGPLLTLFFAYILHLFL